MKIIIDGDACNVIKTTETIAKRYHIPCHIYCDCAHIIDSDYSEIKIVSKGNDAADFAIINHCCNNDIVITNDSGLAAMVLAKKGIAIKSNGIEFTNKNIIGYLNRRYVRKQTRRKTGRDQMKGQLYTGQTPVPKHSYEKVLTDIIRNNILTEVSA